MTILSVWLANPDLALVTLLAGILLLYFECNRPGWVIPGCTGGVLTLLAMHALSIQGIRPNAVILTVLGTLAILLAASLRIRRALQLAVLSAGILQVIGGLRFLLQPLPGRHVHLLTAWVCALLFGCVTYRLTEMALAARRNKRRIGPSAGHWEPSGHATR